MIRNLSLCFLRLFIKHLHIINHNLCCCFLDAFIVCEGSCLDSSFNMDKSSFSQILLADFCKSVKSRGDTGGLFIGMPDQLT